jgi:alpha-L-rhamnosidase
MRTLITSDPFPSSDPKQQGQWPVFWIECPNAGAPPFVTAYRCQFTLNEPRTVRIHVTADERYQLFLNFEAIGRGPERGDADNWFFETYDFDLAAGKHTLAAQVWSFGNQEGAGAPYAQMSVRPGFLLAPQDDDLLPLLGTGVANWEAKKLEGYEFLSPTTAWGTGFNTRLSNKFFDLELGSEKGCEGWQPALKGRPAITIERNDQPPSHRLTPATLPPQKNVILQVGKVRHVSLLKNEPDAEGRLTSPIPIRAEDNDLEWMEKWQHILNGTIDHVWEESLIPPQTRMRVLIDLENYYCAYPELWVSGGRGSRIRIHWQEALFNEFTWKDISKGNRDEIEGKYFTTCWHCSDGVGDEFWIEDKGITFFEPLWWQCGRYVEIVVETGDEALTINPLTFQETRYPLEMESRFDCDDKRLAEVTPIMLRGLQMCAHETYMDCPFYEQLQYVGDTRLQALATYAISHDDRLARKAIFLFDQSRLSDGLTQSRYPSRIRQTTRPFALWWVAMVHDYALWRDDFSFVQVRMPGVRNVIEGYKRFLNSDSLIQLPAGPNMNFMDWVREWGASSPPDGGTGINSLFSLQWALVLTQVAQLETWCGENELASRARRLAQETFDSVIEHFWSEERGLIADDLAQTSFSEHSQCLAVLIGLLDAERQSRMAQTLTSDHDLHRTTIYFTHYLFETFRVLRRPDALLERMDLWFDLKAQGLKTPVEMPEPTRSDCHAWGAHPLFHYFATLLGVRPLAPGFSQVEIAPQLGPLEFINGVMPHPRGEISVDIKRDGDALRGQVSLPDDVTGAFRYAGHEIALSSGRTEISI